jgi:hypothetical protein
VSGSDFDSVTECITLYDKPCGCEGNPRYLLHGCLWFSCIKPGARLDLFECRQCGAVWTMEDAMVETEGWQ